MGIVGRCARECVMLGSATTLVEAAAAGGAGAGAGLVGAVVADDIGASEQCECGCCGGGGRERRRARV